jgi:hypothetical protein
MAAREQAAVVSAKLVEKRRERALKIARPLWGLTTAEITGTEIAKRAGISVASLITHLGPRRKAQEKQRKRNEGSDNA